MRALTKLMIAAALLPAAFPTASAQQVRRDTLHLEVYFQRGSARLDPGFRGNGARLEQIRNGLDIFSSTPGAQIQEVVVRSSVSPEGTVSANTRLSDERAEGICQYLTDQLGVDPELLQVISNGEDWSGLAIRISRLDVPWKQDALNIIHGQEDPEERKLMLKQLEDGAVWSWLDEHVFPDLRMVGGRITCILRQPAEEPVPAPEPAVQKPDTVFVRQKPDTVYVAVPGGPASPAGDFDLSGRRFLFALRTNALAVPLANIGVELPLGEHWSVGVDWYYPWIWRPHHAEGLDYSGRCFELQALDLEARYWFANRRKKPEQRLLGHSIGLYTAVGHYDFEQDWTGHQGEFYNAGLDYLFACPIFHGHAHLEFELGVGYIYSPAQPYDTFVEGDKAYRRKGVKTYISWFGPTRAQASLVIPFYSRKKGGKI